MDSRINKKAKLKCREVRAGVVLLSSGPIGQNGYVPQLLNDLLYPDVGLQG